MVETWLQYFVLCDLLWCVVYECCKHGQTEEKTYNGMHKFIATVIAFAIYYFGGFFNGLLR